MTPNFRNDGHDAARLTQALAKRARKAQRNLRVAPGSAQALSEGDSGLDSAEGK